MRNPIPDRVAHARAAAAMPDGAGDAACRAHVVWGSGGAQSQGQEVTTAAARFHKHHDQHHVSPSPPRSSCRGPGPLRGPHT
ncbi:unnamed protein product [Lampetra fluviatilis]